MNTLFTKLTVKCNSELFSTSSALNLLSIPIQHKHYAGALPDRGCTIYKCINCYTYIVKEFFHAFKISNNEIVILKQAIFITGKNKANKLIRFYIILQFLITRVASSPIIAILWHPKAIKWFTNSSNWKNSFVNWFVILSNKPLSVPHWVVLVAYCCV